MRTFTKGNQREWRIRTSTQKQGTLLMRRKMSEVVEHDLEIARKEILEGWGTAVARNGIVLDRERGRGLRPALQMVRRHGPVTAPSAFADKVLGVAAFRLGWLLGARIMWGEMASSLAVAEGRQRGIEVKYHVLVPSIMNVSREDLCPMEHMAFLSQDDLLFFKQIDGMVR
jgi:hypothetical protein